MFLTRIHRAALVIVLIVVGLSSGPTALATQDDDADPSNVYKGLKLRLIGPAYPSGRISDFAVDPKRPHRYFVAVASGGLWLTENDGITWSPVFDDQGSYAIGVVALDPRTAQTVWLGTGENNSQRSVGWGDGVYKTTDGGKTWVNLGLKQSGHIGGIVIDPRDSNTVYVAAQGPLWSAGGDRGLYKTTDGGKTWNRTLYIDEHTGVTQVLQHPQRPDHLLASGYQRRRHVWVLINGGPGSGLHKSTDGGKTWKKMTSGLPEVEMGRIGIAYAPSKPDIVYAIIEASEVEGPAKLKKKTGPGVYRSEDFGETWKKQSDHMTVSPQYYNELVVDPQNPDRVYSLDTFSHVSIDGGKTWKKLPLEHRHVDDHALWIDPANPAHLLLGGDGGIYESYDYGQTWGHVHNLPITQFYRIAADNAEPFYNVCGGTQDNNSLCAPARTTYEEGIINEDWTVILGGDGYEPQIDPTDPDIIYTQYQYGGLARYDRTTGERVYIVPQPDSGEKQYRWNWNAPLIISPHNPKRLYYGAEKLFRSDDGGSSFRAVSPDLSRKLDRNKLRVMGRVWSVDAVAKNDSTSFYGSLIAVSESPFKEGLIYAGTDDGLIHVTENGGESWRTIKKLPGVPEMTYVEDLDASVHDERVVYAVLDNHKRGDFKPYVYKSSDKGRSWKSIASDLPARGPAHALVEDHKNPNLLFVGTEFGLFFSQNGGANWIRLKGSFPTIAVRDIDIQRREGDLIVGTFGRGIYILDDITALRTPEAQLKRAAATLFSVRDAWLYVVRSRFGGHPKGNRGANYWQADNPPFGAVFTYHLRDGLSTKRKQRREQERKRLARGADNPYPTWKALREEDREEEPAIVLTVTDAQGRIVRHLTGPTAKGMHRVAWDLRYPAPDPIDLEDKRFRPPWVDPPKGPMVLPGTYKVVMAKRVDGKLVPVSKPQTFAVKALDQGSPLVSKDRAGLLAFEHKTAELYRAVKGALKAMAEIDRRIEHLKAALELTPKSGPELGERLRAVETLFDELEMIVKGDATISKRNEPVPWSIDRRISSIVSGHWDSQADVTGTHQRAYQIAAAEFESAQRKLRRIDTLLTAIERELDQRGAPWTPGRLPDWKPIEN